MLPRSLLSYELRGSALRPRYLANHDAPWVQALIDAIDSLVGRSRGDADRILDDRLPQLAAEHRALPSAVSAVRHLLDKYWHSEVKAAVPPNEIRRVVFRLAADTAIPKQEVLGRAAAALGIRVEEVSEGLFADRRTERRLRAPSHEPSVGDIIRQHNLALVQGLLSRSHEVVVDVGAHPRLVADWAKENRLICTYRSTETTAARVAVLGPLAIHRHALPYAVALARFFASVAATADWSIDATCYVDGRAARLLADASDPIESPSPGASPTPRTTEARFTKDFARLGTRWTLHPETAALGTRGHDAAKSPTGDVFFPDFRVEADDQRVYVEVVGFHTPGHLESKLQAAREAGISNLVLCVDESLACSDGTARADQIVFFRKQLNAKDLVDAADRVVAQGHPSPEGHRSDG